MISAQDLTPKQKGALLESFSRKMSPGQAETLIQSIDQMNPATIRIHLNYYTGHIEQCMATEMVKKSKLLQQYFNQKLQSINSIIQNL